MKRIILTLGAFALLFSACKKSDDSTSGGKKGTLTTGRWTIVSTSSVIEYPAPLGTQTIDGMTLISACQRDNQYIFNTDGTGTTDEGPTKCNSSDPQTKSNGTWVLLSNDTQLQITSGSNTVISDIVSMDNNGMTLKYVTTANNIKTTTTTSYSHQ